MGSFRSGLERNNAHRLIRNEVPYSYEPFKIRYTQPARSRLYLPDFVFPNGLVVEMKGRWEAADRKKFLFIQESWPDLEIRFVFSNANAKIRKGGKTTVAEWAEKHGWRWAHKVLPLSWTKEPPIIASQKAINEILKDPINRR